MITNVSLDNSEENCINITARKNDTFGPLVFEVNNVDEEGTVTGPYDLTNHTGLMQVKGMPTKTDAVLIFTTDDSSMSFGGGDNNEITIQKDNTDMDITAESYTYDLQVTDTVSGKVLTIIKGKFIVNQDVTE